MEMLVWLHSSLLIQVLQPLRRLLRVWPALSIVCEEEHDPSAQTNVASGHCAAFERLVRIV